MRPADYRTKKYIIKQPDTIVQHNTPGNTYMYDIYRWIIQLCYRSCNTVVQFSLTHYLIVWAAPRISQNSESQYMSAVIVSQQITINVKTALQGKCWLTGS